MTWRVEWNLDALADLGQLLYEGVEPTVLSDTMQAIEASLQEDPESCGESRENNERIVFETPLAIRCKIFPDRSVVEIFSVWQSKRR